MKKQCLTIITILVPSLLFLGCSHQGLKVKTDGGVFRSNDGGLSFEPKHKIDEETNIGNVNINDIEVVDGNIIYIGTRNNGMFKSEDNGETWKPLFTGSNVWQIEIDPSNSDVIYIAVTVNRRGKIFRSRDAGLNWEEIYSQARLDFDILTLEIDERNPSNIYAGDSQGVVFKSSDSGGRWRAIDRQKTPISLIKIGKSDSGKIYYMSGKALRMSSNGGEIFENLRLPSVGTNVSITSIEVDPRNSEIIYVSSSQAIFKSIDGGQNFSEVNILNPRGPAISNVAINPQNSREWFYGAGFAIYKTSDNGVTWSVSQINTNRRVRIIAINPTNTDIIYLGMERVERK